MAVEPISFKKLLKKTDDIYEAVLVASKRAKQILQDRVVKQMIDENQEIVDDDGIFAEPVVREDIDYDKEEKVTSMALNEFLDGKIDWNKSDELIEK
ncbi:MAG TPA: DNA-directed RNA polymerase subunit omega [Candidatus Marinimicrobia bacterium]|nr:DNA-directed RNA polymerase subunit omega [Candidatus Neomarinimicrobiota bacterium]|tara:strand:+ start:902 stop:1192 length:291 start_codon:yes stop_codon:yes gene_type:complete